MEKPIKKEYIVFSSLIALGVFARFVAMSLGHNFDWESYCIVGEIAGNFRNVYAETTRYNYGPVFFCIQGLLYRIALSLSSLVGSNDFEGIYRILMVSVLTGADLGITCYAAKNYSLKIALIFFLNPVSIIITGYHNQFDNIAILLALLTIKFFNEEETINKKDVYFVLLFSICLITKHILFMMPFFLLFNKNLRWKKKILYSFIPPFLFLLSFVPFALQSQAALSGIINNVFLYRSANNSPLLVFLYQIIKFPENYKIVVYMVIMITIAFGMRREKYENQVLVYLIAMVAFSSAMANQYFAIPMISLCVLNTKAWKYIYMLLVGASLVLHENGFNIIAYINNAVQNDFIKNALYLFVKGKYVLATWILLLTLIFLFINSKRKDNIRT